MKTVSLAKSSSDYVKTLDLVFDNRQPIIITRAGKEPVVALPLEDYQSIVETAYLMRSPENYRRLLTAAKRMEQCRGQLNPKQCVTK